MRRICAWCKKDMGETEPLDDPTVTHGICGPCEAAAMEEFEEEERQRREQYEVALMA